MAIAIVGMGITILLKKGGQFPETHVGHNKNMQKRKIYCAKTFDRMEQNAVSKRRKIQRVAQASMVQVPLHQINAESLSLVDLDD